MKKKIKIKVGTEEDYIKAIKKWSRNTFGFVPTKKFKNKRKYTRKKKHHEDLCD